MYVVSSHPVVSSLCLTDALLDHRAQGSLPALTPIVSVKERKSQTSGCRSHSSDKCTPRDKLDIVYHVTLKVDIQRGDVGTLGGVL
mmetsp:Transcript_26924/g.67059  ORF Transcript_26924/g.67059 Transcript_26924/m.67059 type:complete len:86 (-) Transcript_26924:281-538(-)